MKLQLNLIAPLLFLPLVRLLLVGVVLNTLCFAAEPPKSLAGYGKTSWGMSPAEVLLAEAPRAVRLAKPDKYKDAWGVVRIPQISIGSNNFNVEFLFDSVEGKLGQVLVKSTEEKNVGINIDTYRALEHLLVGKYGPPTFRSDAPARAEGHHLISWKLEQTTIELDHMFIPQIMTYVAIAYRPTATSVEVTKDL